jgi:hypothetical protein
MATERQIAANQANAKRSTGPKTALVKKRSSRNAFRHGLSGPLPHDALTMAATDAIVNMLSGDLNVQEACTRAFARAQLELRRIWRVRESMFKAVMSASAEPGDVRRLMALDRYERIVRTKRRRAKQLITGARAPKAGK